MGLLHQNLWKAVEKNAARIAFDTLQETLTYEQLADRVQRTAGSLGKLGVSQGDHIAILAPNCIEYIVYHYAASVLGAVLVVLNTRHAGPELVNAINDAEAGVLVVHKDCEAHMPLLEERCDTVRFIVGIGRVDGADFNAAALAAARLEPLPPVRHKADDPVVMLFTSGTTGRPKGALQTHAGIDYIDRTSADVFETNENDVYLAFLPYFHQAGLARTRSVLMRGGKILITGRMDPEAMVQCMVEKEVSITNLLPPVDARLMEIARRNRTTFPSLRLILGGGGLGDLHAHAMEKFCKATGSRFIGIYGQTEVTGPATVIADGEYFSRPTSCGKAIPGTEIEIWDDTGTAVKPGERGEIMVRSLGCVPGYWDNPEASESLTTRGWLHTGDLGSLDEEGFLYFLGRKKELIKTGGENVYPLEVEAILRQHPNVLDMTVLGVPDPGGWGEKVAALFITRDGDELSLEEVKSFCKEKIAGYKIPKVIKCVQEIPRNFAGKPAKHKLVSLFDESVSAVAKIKVISDMEK